MTNMRSPLIAAPPTPRRNSKRVAAYTVCGGVLLIFILLTAVCVNGGSRKIAALRTEVDKLIRILKTVGENQRRHYSPEKLSPASRGVDAGVSDKAFRLRSEGGSVTPYPWTDNMLSWQRTAFHFQPLKNWMNGPMFYKGWYHFFYQYNQDAAVWGRIAWGHAVSRDLINWLHLPLAMVSDQWYDANGVWTGSATILPDGSVVMVYTGSTLDHVQVQNLAFPADPSDPLLIDWVKYEGNPVLYPPPGIDFNDFRDPTTAWQTPEGKWRMAIGSRVNTTGISLVYETEDFKEYRLVERLLHGVEGTGMWECVDFYPVAVGNLNGLDTSAGGAGIKHVLKASLDDEKNDYYAVGRYQRENATWLPEEAGLDVGMGLRYDYGKFYASKTFYDESKQRRILWGWVMETDSEAADVRKGWASLQAIPRTVALDQRTGKGIIQWPVEEVERLRRRGRSFNGVEVRGGETVALDAGSPTQLDITVEFEVEREVGGGEGEGEGEGEEEYSCENGGGAEKRGELGPFGVVVHGDREGKEQTAVFFYGVRRGRRGKETYFCVDQRRSSMAEEVDRGVYGSRVRVEEGEREKVRVIVDHSIVESFAQGGRTCVTSRVYPTRGGGSLMLFNNATGLSVRAWVNTWEMASATMRTFST